MERTRQTVGGRAILVLALLLALAACSGRGGGSGSSPVTISDSIAQSPYDWDHLVWDGYGRVAYVVDGTVRSRTGIDVSEHQGDIDWQAVADDGISFCYVRAAWRGSTEGGLFADELFEQNYTGAREAGLDTGLYVYSQAVNAEEAREEAQLWTAARAGHRLRPRGHGRLVRTRRQHQPGGAHGGRAHVLRYGRGRGIPCRHLRELL